MILYLNIYHTNCLFNKIISISDKKNRGITKPYYGYTKKIVNRYESPGISIINMKHSSNTDITKNCIL